MATAVGAFAFTITDADSASSPAAAYSAWCAALGVSDTTTLYALNDDDFGWAISFASPSLAANTDTGDQSASGSFGSEASLGFYQKDISNSSSAGQTLPGVNRAYGVATLADVVASFHPAGGDLRSEAVKLQKSGTVTVIAGRVRQYNNAAVNLVEFAARFDGVSWVMVFAPSDVSVDFKLFGLVSGNYVQGYTYTVAAGATKQFTLTNVAVAAVQAPVVIMENFRIAAAKPGASFDGIVYRGPLRAYNNFSILGAEAKLVGTVKEKHTPTNTPLRRMVRLIRERDGAVVGVTWSDETTGAYVFTNIDSAEVYSVVSYDYTHTYRAQIADNLSIANGGVVLV